MQVTASVGQVNDCCKQPDNLELQYSDNPDLTIKKCKVCARKHYILKADLAKFGIEERTDAN